MPNIPILTINGTDYKLKDTDLRKEFEGLRGSLHTKAVSNNKSGRKISDTKVLDISDYTFVQGTSNKNTGEIVLNATRITSEYIYIDNGYMITVKSNSGYKNFVSEYDFNENLVNQTAFATDTTVFLQGKSETLIRITAAKSGDTEIAPNEASEALKSIQIYKYNQNDIQQARTNAIGTEQAIQFTYGADNGSTTRARSGYFFFDDCIIENTGSQTSLISLAFDLYDENYTFIAGSPVNLKSQVLYLRKADFPTAKYIVVYAANCSDITATLTEEMLSYLNSNISLKRYSPVDLNSLSVDDLRYQQVQAIYASDHYMNCYSNTTRIYTKNFYKNIGQLITLVDSNYKIYARYYDADFHFVKDSAWNTTNIDTSEETYPYFSLCFNKGNNEAFQSEDMQKIIDAVNVNGALIYGATINGTNGEINKNVGAIRCATYRYLWIEDAYIKFHNCGFDGGIAIYNAQKQYIGAKDWFTYSNEIGRTDKAIRLQKCYVRFYFAKQNRTSEFTVADRIDLQNKILDGSYLEITEAVHPHALGFQATNGYPEYYADEMKQTINTICNKIGRDSTVFAMITDLHDNDNDHYSETLAYQQNALRLIKNKSRLDFVLCGGDLTDGAYSSKQELLDKFTDHRNHFSMINAPTLFMRGNHDENSYFSKVADNCITKNEFYARLISPESENISPAGTAYYYRDFDKINVRVIVLDFIDYPWVVDSNGYLVNYAVGGDGVWRGYSNEQIQWLAGTALNTNKRIIITGHYSTHRNLMSTWEKETDHNWDEVNKAMIAYQTRGTYAFNGQTYSYADKTGKILVQVTGHSHSFGAFKENGIIWSTTGSPSTDVTHRTYDNTQYETMGSRAYGDITEAHFNVFVCDNDNVHIISFGQMGDLDFTI